MNHATPRTGNAEEARRFAMAPRIRIFVTIEFAESNHKWFLALSEIPERNISKNNKDQTFRWLEAKDWEWVSHFDKWKNQCTRYADEWCVPDS